MCGEKGGLNNHWIFWWAILLPTLLWSNFDVSISNPLTAPLKFVPLSETISDGRPIQLMNLCIALMKLSLSNDPANSRCTTRTDIQKNMQPHLFTPHPVIRRRDDVLAASFSTSQQRCRFFIKRNIQQRVCRTSLRRLSVCFHDALLERRDDVSRGSNNGVLSVCLHDVSNRPQMKHPTTS